MIQELAEGLSNEEKLTDNDMTIILRFMDFFINLFKNFWDYHLTDTERRRLMGSGIRRYGFIDKTSDIAAVNPAYYPKGFDAEELKNSLREIEFFRNFLQKIRTFERIFSNALLVRSDEAYRESLLFYRYVRTLIPAGDEGAITIYNMLESFFQRPRRSSDEPSDSEVEHDLRSLLKGTKDGEIIVKNETPKLTGGKHLVVDHTHKAGEHVIVDHTHKGDEHWKAHGEGEIKKIENRKLKIED